MSSSACGRRTAAARGISPRSTAGASTARPGSRLRSLGSPRRNSTAVISDAGSISSCRPISIRPITPMRASSSTAHTPLDLSIPASLFSSTARSPRARRCRERRRGSVQRQGIAAADRTLQARPQPCRNRRAIAARRRQDLRSAGCALAKKRFLLLDNSSEFVLPRIARVARAPDLGATPGGRLRLRPGAAKAPKLYVGAPDKDKLSAAITLAVKMAVSAGRPIAFQFTAFAPDGDSGAVLALETIEARTQPESRAAPSPASAATTEQGDLFPRVAARSCRSAVLAPAGRRFAGPRRVMVERRSREPVDRARDGIRDGDRLLVGLFAVGRAVADGRPPGIGFGPASAPPTAPPESSGRQAHPHGKFWPRLSGVATLAMIGGDGQVLTVAEDAEIFRDAAHVHRQRPPCRGGFLSSTGGLCRRFEFHRPDARRRDRLANAQYRQEADQMRTLVLLLACLSILAVTPRVRAEPPLKLDARNLALVGALKNPGQWEAYKRAFITAQGRVVDTGNGDISHSEGQGYGMLLAVAANDRAAFDLIWGWTRANLMVRPDALFAWRWEANARPAVADFNDAADGDILIAWALSEAGEAWRDAAYRVAARRTATDVAHKLIVKGAVLASLLLPGTVGFSAKDRRDGPVANLSYWVFPAFARLKLVAPEVDWDGLTQAALI